jgi:hypothetical protein
MPRQTLRALLVIVAISGIAHQRPPVGEDLRNDLKGVYDQIESARILRRCAV